MAKMRPTRDTSKGELSARKVQPALKLPIGVRIIQQKLSSSPHLKYKNMSQALLLTSDYKKERLSWTFPYAVKSDHIWVVVVFSDAKKFNLYGPDGLAYYYHYLSRREHRFAKRQQGI